MPIHVNVDNFVRAETHRMFAGLQRDAGGVCVFRHNREPASIEEQTVIRMNRDTLYSFAVVDLDQDAALTLPDTGGRYLSAMVVNEDHLVVDVIRDSGRHPMERRRLGSRYVAVAVRTLVDPDDPDDVTAVAVIQDGIAVDAGSTEPFVPPDYDAASLDATRSALLDLARGLTTFDRTFGTREEVDPVRHLIGTAAGWGGLPTSEASYLGVEPNVPSGDYELVLRDVPVDAFWSISVYDAQGFFAPNALNRYSVNSVTAVPDADGAVTVRFSPSPAPDAVNSIVTPDGWNFLLRLYRPLPAFTDGTWVVPELTPTG